MTRYLVTGGAGFIGSHLVHSLVSKGAHVKVLDKFITGKKRHLQDVFNDIELIEGDFTDPETIKKAVQNVDVIFHQGAMPSVPKSIKDPIATNQANVTGTLQLLHAAVKAGVRRFIYAASSSVYGNSDVLPKQEDMIAAPLSPYAVSKYAGERYCKAFYEVYGLETISLRYFNVFGPNQDPHSEYAAVIPSFIHALLSHQTPLIYGDGKQSRDFTYIDNVVSANLLAAEAPKLQGEAINIGSGERTDLVTLVKKINVILGTDIAPVYTSERAGDVMHSLADLRLAENLVGYRPGVSFTEGLKQTVNALMQK
ncbi:SDR family oxidoreductase [Salicibibacter cibarius]|uniref:SDR family oxidoreductase n=1 Tax=Salicibibacter cibarius TaxID=2743000 RepID=A0A7T6Z3F7_9BACI|nr:SDR family oxidoreductase [Salicibibacter cibarius]QQK75701.1 SDR family oxidoreductase [Salicibibacter cibarius]